MNKKKLNHQFVNYIPENIENGILYISIPYTTVVHKCCCGCGKEVITPLSPTDWKIIFDGETISLHPSIGNWSFKCRSHYWIKRNKVSWAGDMTHQEIEAGRLADKIAKAEQFNEKVKSIIVEADTPTIVATQELASPMSFYKRIVMYLKSSLGK